MTIAVAGAGLAGAEAAYYLAKRGHNIRLFDIKPSGFTPAHSYEGFAELVCSNSLKSDDPQSASGLLKAEMRLLGSLVMEAADKNRVSAGSALAVDRISFSNYITKKIKAHPMIESVCEEFTDPKLGGYDSLIIATGPLTTPALCKALSALTGSERLYFFDAAAPVVSGDSIDYSTAFPASRYNKGTPDYINCPMTQEQYSIFHKALIEAVTVQPEGFEGKYLFEGCMPIEELAKRGYMTPLFGPMKPVGIQHPDRHDEKFYAVVQLRKENESGTMYNIVGFQTRLKFGEQKRVFSMIPGLEKAEFLRYGVMHRNTYINSPGLLDRFYSLKSDPTVFFAGQITGVEGYLESAASGLYAAIQADRRLSGKAPYELTAATVTGALAKYVSEGGADRFQPMNANFGIMEALHDVHKRDKKTIHMQNSLNEIKCYLDSLNLTER